MPTGVLFLGASIQPTGANLLHQTLLAVWWAQDEIYFAKQSLSQRLWVTSLCRWTAVMCCSTLFFWGLQTSGLHRPFGQMGVSWASPAVGHKPAGGAWGGVLGLAGERGEWGDATWQGSSAGEGTSSGTVLVQPKDSGVPAGTPRCPRNSPGIAQGTWRPQLGLPPLTNSAAKKSVLHCSERKACT